MSTVAASPSPSTVAASMTHAARQPKRSIRKATGSGMTMPAEERPIVAKASARPRRRTNQRATVASPVRSPSAMLPKAITTP
jgi:hypothetical protein